MIDEYKKYNDSFSYMADVDRTRERIGNTGEYFTPIKLVMMMLDMAESKQPDIFSDPTKVYFDSGCGDGQLLVGAILRKLEQSKCSLVQALKTTYGIELMQDNVDLCRKRLAGPNPTKEIVEIVNHNIVCSDAFKWDVNNWCSNEETNRNRWNGEDGAIWAIWNDV